MITIARKIEIEFKKISPMNTIFKRIKYRLYIFQFIIMIPAIISFFFFFENQIYFYLVLALSILGLLLFFYCYVNQYAKKQLSNFKINYNNGFLEHWANENYFEYKYVSFKNNLIDKNILSLSDETNINLLDEYFNYFKLKAEKSTKFDMLKTITATVLLFVLPVWIKLLELLYNTNNPQEDSIIFSFKILVPIIIFIIAIVYIGKLFKEIYGRKSTKMDQIADELLNLKWDIKIKNI
jgi:hypothetical protein